MEGLAGPQFADCVVPVWQAKAARDATWKAKQRWMEGQADSMARLQETGGPGSDVVCGAYAGGPARSALSARLNQCLVTTESLSRLFRRRPISISESL